ncbi:MAG: FecR domain-containing protein [Bacteroidota bacterium]
MNELLAKYFSGDASTDEKASIEEWRSLSDENASEFLEASETWFQRLKGQEFDTVSALAAVKAKINATDEDNSTKVVAMDAVDTSTSSFQYFKYAAGIVLAVGIGLAYWLTNTAGVAPEKTYATLDNQTLEIELADGSVVTLNESSELTVTEGFNSTERGIVLEGTAFFDVARDEQRPFIISANDAEVKVLGTSFLVRTEDDMPVTEVIVKSGSVSLAGVSERSNGVVLKPGEIGVADSRKRGVVKRNNRDANYLAWQDKVITFDKTSLAEVANTLSDVYKVDVEFDSNIKNCQITAQFQKQSLESVVEIISQTFGFDVKSKGDSFKFTGDGC